MVSRLSGSRGCPWWPQPLPYATRVPLPDERRGILLQPAWLASFARTGETDPIHRGRFVSESLLCRPIPPIPIELDPLLPDLPGATMRERLEEHTQEPCVGCHQLMDPIGLSLEAFDHVGRFRTEELGRPVDVSGELTSAGSQSGELDGGPLRTGRYEHFARGSRSLVDLWLTLLESVDAERGEFARPTATDIRLVQPEAGPIETLLA